MPISLSTTAITAERALRAPTGETSGCFHSDDFAVVDPSNTTKQIRLDPSGVTAGTAITLAAPSVSGTIGLAGVLNTVQYSAPTAGATVAYAAASSILILEPAGTLATLTVTMPAASDGSEFRLTSTQIVTALTLTPNGTDTVVTNTTSLAVGVAITYVARSGKWYKA